MATPVDVVNAVNKRLADYYAKNDNSAFVEKEYEGDPIDDVIYEFENLVLFDVSVNEVFDTWTEFVDLTKHKVNDYSALEDIRVCGRLYTGFKFARENRIRRDGIGKRDELNVKNVPFSPFSDEFQGWILGQFWEPLSEKDAVDFWSWIFGHLED